MAADLDQDGTEELLVLWARKPAWLFVQGSDGDYTRAKETRGYRKSLLDNLTPNRTTLADVTGDGRPELLVSGRGFVRALRRDESGLIQVVDQFNAVNAQAEVVSALPADLEGDGIAAILLLEERNDQLDLLRRQADGVYRPDQSYSIGTMDIVGSRLLHEADGSASLLYLGKDRFWLIPTGPGSRTLKTTGSREAVVEEMKYRMLSVGDLNGDGVAEIILLDNEESRILEVLQREKGGWREALHFGVFDQHNRDGENGTSGEPRELLVRDLTGDGRDDIVFLVHDRVLIYRGY